LHGPSAKNEKPSSIERRETYRIGDGFGRIGAEGQHLDFGD